MSDDIFSLDPSEETPIESSFALPSLPSASSRTDALDVYDRMLSQKSSTIKDLLYDDKDLPVDYGKSFASALLGLLPIAIGATQYGLQGAAVGAGAGATAAKPLLDEEIANEKRREAERALKIKMAQDEAKTLSTERAALQRQEFQAQDQMNRMSMQSEVNAANARNQDRLIRQRWADGIGKPKGESADGTAANTGADFEEQKRQAAKSLERIGASDEQRNMILSSADQKSLLFNTAEVRRQRQLEMQAGGTIPKNLPNYVTQSVSAASSIDERVKPLKALVEQVRRGLPEDEAGAYTLAQIKSRLPLNEQQNLDDNLQFFAGQITKAIFGNAPSDQERKIISNYLASINALSMDKLPERIDQLVEQAKIEARSKLEDAATQSQFSMNAQNLIKEKGRFLGMKVPGEDANVPDDVMSEIQSKLGPNVNIQGIRKIR